MISVKSNYPRWRNQRVLKIQRSITGRHISTFRIRHSALLCNENGYTELCYSNNVYSQVYKVTKMNMVEVQIL